MTRSGNRGRGQSAGAALWGRLLLPLLLLPALLLAGCADRRGGESAALRAESQVPALRPALSPAPPALRPLGPEPPGKIRRITYLLPGALTTSAIFGPLREARQADHLVMEYRYPGMQDQPLDPPMQLGRVAGEIAAHAASRPGAQIEFVAYSAGGAIALEAAARIGPGRARKLVILSGAAPFPGAWDSAGRGGLALLAAVITTGSLQPRAIWSEYYKTLLYGYGWRKDPALRRLAEARAARDRARLTLPVKGRGRAQTRDLLFWQLPAPAALAGADILFIHGSRDPVFTPGRMAGVARRLEAEFCLVKGAGHVPLTTHPGVVHTIGAYLEGRWQPPCAAR